MDEAMSVGLKDEIIAALTIELQDVPTFNADILAVKVLNVMREVKMKRNYVATSFTDEQIEKDLYNYYSVIMDVARFDYNQLGAEGEQSHSENGISRSYVNRDDLFKGVHAFVKVF